MVTFEPRRLMITGGAGFIGSNLTRAVLEPAGVAGHAIEAVVVLDAFTYAGHRANLAGVQGDPRFHLVEGDICDRHVVERVLAEHAIDAVLHLAAESHVDRSIEAADVFVRTNVTGTFTLLEGARRAWEGRTEATRFVHVSTDEVYGALDETGVFSETTPYAPNSPYAASKAASDLLARSYWKTHGLPVVITNCCNNYGPHQLPEKMIPLMITNAAEGRPLPVYGQGKQIREWLHVDDHCAALGRAMTHGAVGESYNFGSGEEMSNLQLVELIADLVDRELGRGHGASRALIQFVPDRKGHDFRYAIDSSKARRMLGWETSRSLERQLAETVRWYLGNPAWRRAVATEEHRRFQAAHYRTSR
ncbi:MAG TPA: dTDP-glucose 4,6-dehydratase [Kofleriaceae bacterium]|nr:dTDP-glucose 4,6-dehydratase [Kofleriaceae bacterium]